MAPGGGKEKRAEQLGAWSEKRGKRRWYLRGVGFDWGLCGERGSPQGLFDSATSSILVYFIETSPAV